MVLDIERKRVLVIEDATTRLKNIVIDGMLSALDKTTLKTKVSKLIESTKKKLEELESDEELIENTIIALKQSFLLWYEQILATLKKIEKKDELGIVAKTIKQMESSVKLGVDNDSMAIIGVDNEIQLGGANITNLREYMTIYEEGALGRYVDYASIIKSNLVSITNEINEGSLSRYDSLGRKKSIRNMAEIKARYDLITDDLNKIKASGVQYVVATAHANASERCSWWQGKIFLIDLDLATREMGQYGGAKPKQTVLGHIDGKPYYSLKEACENGFLSYNCQHRLIKYYKGVYLPKYNLVEVEKKRNLSQHQRYLENMIRKHKIAQINSITEENRLEEGANVARYEEEYYNFCKNNKLTRYDWRCEVLENELN